MRTLPLIQTAERIRTHNRKKLRCPKCRKKNFVLFEDEEKLEIECKNCQAILFGFRKKGEANNEGNTN